MFSVNRQSLESQFREKLKGVVQDHNFFPSYYKLPTNILRNHSEVRGTDTSFSSTNNINPNSEKRSILVVDDDHDIANLFKLSLENEGFVVHTFNDPLLALSNYKAGAYDLLLLDIKMPQMNGFELYQKIRLVDNRIKVCFITAFEEYHTEFKELFPTLKEGDCLIRKPVELQLLTKKVRSRLQGE